MKIPGLHVPGGTPESNFGTRQPFRTKLILTISTKPFADRAHANNSGVRGL